MVGAGAQAAATAQAAAKEQHAQLVGRLTSLGLSVRWATHLRSMYRSGVACSSQVCQRNDDGVL